MQLAPRYGDDPILVLDGDPGAVAAPAIRQRRRLAETVSGFTAEQWAHPTRCELWSARDVISHLDTTNGFWAGAIDAGRRGEPTRFLATFDPVASPTQLVDATAARSDDEVLSRFLASNERLIGLWESLEADEWRAPAEAPPGHVAIGAVSHHALWDSWVHERDILLPMAVEPAVEPDEVAACLHYAVALTPAFALTVRPQARGTLAVTADDPSCWIRADVGPSVTTASGAGRPPTDVPAADVALTGDAVELLEALSMRRPLDAAPPAEHAWLMQGLALVFDVAPTETTP